MTENYVTVYFANSVLARVFWSLSQVLKQAHQMETPKPCVARVIKTITFDRDVFLLKRLQKERKIGGSEKSLTLYILYMFMP